MTINLADNDPRVSYSVAESVTQTSFSVPFEFFADADLNVYVDGTLKTLTTDYTVTGGDGSTGTVSISVTGATGGSTVVITRDIALERTTDFPTSGPFDVNSLNIELDKQIAMIADLRDKTDRALQVTDYDSAVSVTLPVVNARKGKTLAFNASTGAVEAGPSISDVQTVSAASADIATLADIQDGTVATNAITTVSGISANVTTVAGVAANVSTVAGISSDVTSVAADATDIGTVATNIASVNTVAGNISEVIAVANDLNEAVSEVETVANDLNEAVSEIETVAASISNVDAVGTNIANVNTVAGNNSNVTTVAGISANVTTVAGISGNVTTVAGNSTNINTVAGISADVTTVAGDSAAIQAVAADATDIGTVSTNIANVNTVAGSIANVNTTAANITGVNSFAERYRVGATDPTTSLDEGDLFFNTTDNTYKFYDGTSWQTVNVSGIGSVLDDATPQLGGNLDTNGNNITFGDNDKAIFGAGSDLQIYHDGLASYVQDVGTGPLYLQGNGGVVIRNYDGSQTMGNFTVGGNVDLYHNNVKKFNTTSGGIDVTGTVTADGLTVDGTDDANNLIVGHNNTNFAVYNDSTVGEIRLKAEDGSGSNFSKYMTFYTHPSGSAATERMRITSSGNVGIGTSAPNYTLQVGDGTADTRAVFNPNSAFAIGVANSTGFAGWIGGSGVTDNMVFSNSGGTERMRIDSSGNVGIGTASPNTKLELGGGTSGQTLLFSNTANNTGARLSGAISYRTGSGYTGKVLESNITGAFDDIYDLRFFTANTGASSERMRINSSGNVGIGTSSPVQKLDVNGGNIAVSSADIYQTSVNIDNTDTGGRHFGLHSTGSANTAGRFRIYDYDANVERMTIASGGNVGIGKNSPSTALDVNGTVTATAFVGDGSGLTGLGGGAVGLTDVGSFIMARSNGGAGAGATKSGSVIVYSNANGSATSAKPNVGTWRIHGYAGTLNNQDLTTVFQRIS